MGLSEKVFERGHFSELRISSLKKNNENSDSRGKMKKKGMGF